jgi:hypothetical protein
MTLAPAWNRTRDVQPVTHFPLIFDYFPFTQSWSAELLSRDNAVGIATGYGPDGQEVGVRVPVGAGYFPLHVVQTGSGAHPAYYPMGTGGSFPEG